MLIFPTLDHICSEEYQDMCDAQIKTGALSTFVVVLAIFFAGILLTITVFFVKKEKVLKNFMNCYKREIDQDQYTTPTNDSVDQPLKQLDIQVKWKMVTYTSFRENWWFIVYFPDKLEK